MPLNSSVSYGGVAGIRALRFPFGRGVTPSIAALYCVPQEIDPSGPLTISFNGSGIVFTDMAVSAAHVRHRKDGRHPLMVVYLKDRRWRWSGTIVGGDWNRRSSDGNLDFTTQKTPGQLAALLLDALGESGYDVSQMPTGVWPRASWQNTRADIALQRLCDSVACEVTLNPLSNRVVICRAGIGSSLPTGVSEVLPRYRFAPRANVPNRVIVLCGHSLWQSRLQLKAVARNAALQQQLLAAWSGMPSGGLSTESPISFPNVSATNLRVLAFSDYLRHFRVTGQANGSLGVPNFPYPIGSVEQYVLNDFCLEVETDLTGYKRNIPYYLDGDYWAYTDVAANTSSQIFLGPSKLHTERRLVELEYPLFKLSSSGAYQEPALYLNTSYKLRTNEGQFGGLFRFGVLGGSGGDLVLQRPEIFSAYNLSTGINNESNAIAEADNYVQLFMQKYANPWSCELTYPGLSLGSPDGNIAQVVWHWTVTGAPRTTFSEGEELDPYTPSPNERRRRLSHES
jgi:hypothetical protein